LKPESKRKSKLPPEIKSSFVWWSIILKIPHKKTYIDSGKNAFLNMRASCPCPP
jgi:hypothetical protein